MIGGSRANPKQDVVSFATSSRWSTVVGVGFWSLFHIQCVSSNPSTFEVAVQEGSVHVTPEVSSTKAPMDHPPAPSSLVKPATAECVLVPGVKGELPHYLPTHHVVVTRFASPCSPSPEGIGMVPKSPWLAMGFPCTGGGGRIDIKGKYHHPGAVSFAIGTECPMTPSTKEQVQSLFVEKVGIPQDAPLAAFLPFVVQYWEVIGYQDADMGFIVDLKSPSALDKVWKNFRENRGFGVHLYGRENSWVPGRHLYQVDAVLYPDKRNTFRLSVQGVKILGAEEMQKIRQRCELLRPARHCSAVF